MSYPRPFAVGTVDGTLRVRGELDMANAHVLRSHLDALFEREDGDVMVDLSDVTFIDASGVEVLFSADAQLRVGGRRRLRILTPSRAVLRLLDLAGLTEHFAELPITAE